MFKNRYDAGLQLAKLLKGKPYIKDSIIIAIPRGGVVVGKVISEKLNLRLCAMVIKKIGAPNNPELAIGAVGSSGVVFWDNEIIRNLGIDKNTIKDLKEKKEKEVKEREEYLEIKFPDVAGKTVVIVDDGVATGSTVRTAAKILRGFHVGKIVLATPVISRETFEHIKADFDEIIFLLKPAFFRAVGEFYQDFLQVEDEEVKKILNSKFQTPNFK